MLDIKDLNHLISKLKSDGAEKFLKHYAVPEESPIDGVYHYASLIPEFDKFILFDFDKVKEISLVLSNKNIKLSDLNKYFSFESINYDFREDKSKVIIDDKVYVMIDGKIDDNQPPTFFTDAKGNVKTMEEITVQAIIVELD